MSEKKKWQGARNCMEEKKHEEKDGPMKIGSQGRNEKKKIWMSRN